MKDQAKIIAALLVGAAAGAALGLLLAPDSGEGTRNSISDQFNDFVGKAKNRAQSATDELREYGNSAVDRAKSKFRSGVDEMNNYRDHASDMVDNAKDHIDNAKSRVKNVANDLG